MSTIVISGLSGTGKTTIARKLAKKLGIDYFSVTDLFRDIYPRDKELERIIKIWREYKITKATQLKIENSQIQVAKRGNVVIDGEIAIYVLRRVPSFKIWLTAEESIRVERIAKRDGFGIEEARTILAKKERYESEFFRKFYGIKLNILDTYADFTIDTSFLPTEEIINKIIRVMPK